MHDEAKILSMPTVKLKNDIAKLAAAWLVASTGILALFIAGCSQAQTSVCTLAADQVIEKMANIKANQLIPIALNIEHPGILEDGGKADTG
jgi:HAMP domain-containing protein